MDIKDFRSCWEPQAERRELKARAIEGRELTALLIAD